MFSNHSFFGDPDIAISVKILSDTFRFVQFVKYLLEKALFGQEKVIEYCRGGVR